MALSDIKFSNVDVDFMKRYLRIDEDFDEDDTEIQLFLEVAKSWVISHTEMTEEQLDEINFATILLIKFTAYFYNDRTAKYSNKFDIDLVMDMLLTKIRSYNLGNIEQDDEEIQEEV